MNLLDRNTAADDEDVEEDDEDGRKMAATFARDRAGAGCAICCRRWRRAPRD